MTCDYAEFYKIYDFRALPCAYAAALAAGLDDRSRIKKKMSGARTDLKTYLLAAIADRLAIIIWSRTKEGQHNMKKPKMFTELLNKDTVQNEKPIAFSSKEALDYALNSFRRK